MKIHDNNRAQIVLRANNVMKITAEEFSILSALQGRSK